MYIEMEELRVCKTSRYVEMEVSGMRKNILVE